MEIILIRHGIAEDRSSDRPDETRSLTDAGRKRLERTLPGYHRFMNWNNHLVVWSSPLLRALQTAEIIARHFHVPDIRQQDFLSNGDFDAFIKSLDDVADDASLILVGHEPYLGEWSRQFAGITLPFKKGSAAGFKLKTISPLNVELLWFAQPSTLSRLGEH